MHSIYFRVKINCAHINYMGLPVHLNPKPRMNNIPADLTLIGPLLDIQQRMALMKY